ncbi:MAG: TlpA family protein disulfide reductase [Bacteroidales bacterium]|nr:TlpA family protein disulfide reductase [Bacteroidales bacterium]
MKILLLILLVITSLILTAQNAIPVKNFQELEPRLHMDDDYTWVINFWATWCAPCVKEMPYFEQIGKEYAGKGVKVLLVSLDFVNQLDARVIPFVKKNDIKSEVILLNDPRANSWIPKVSDKWSGALPATLIYNKNHRSFYEQTFSFDELEDAVKKALSDQK